MDYRSTARSFGILDRRSQNYIVTACASLGLTFSEYVLMLNLYENEGVRQDDMAALMCVDKAVVARTIKMLESKELVSRVQGTTDKRVKRIYATPAGKEQEEFLRNVLQRWIDYLSAGVDPLVVPALLQGFAQLAQRAKTADFSKILNT